MTVDEGRRYLLIEVPAFAGSDRPAMTSFLGLGGLEGVLPAVASGDTAKKGAGADLAARVNGFLDDDRDKCDPPEADGPSGGVGRPATRPALAPGDRSVKVGAPPGPSMGSADAMALANELAVARERAEKLRSALDAVLPDPAAWLDELVRQREAAIVEEQAARAAFQAASAEADPADGAQLPPAFCAPGYAPKGAGPVGAEASAGEAPPFAEYVPKAERQDTSARLHKAGGWRDHTDGNRVSTTRGDKVEVVGGNYRLVVLGRTDEPVDAAGNPVLPGFDVSGGHIDEESTTRVVPESAVSWRRRYNGNWYVVEESVRADSVSTTTGDTRSESFGHRADTTVGSDSPHRWHEPEHCPGGRCRANPKILDETWAEEVRSFTGSEGWRIPQMRDATYADCMQSETHAQTLHETQRAVDRWSTTTAGRIEDDTVADAMESSTLASTMSDTTYVATERASVTIGGLMLDATIGDSTSRTLGLTTDLFVGARATVNLSASSDISIGVKASVSVGRVQDLTVGVSWSVQKEGVREVTCGMRNERNLGKTSQLALVMRLTGAHIEVG